MMKEIIRISLDNEMDLILTHKRVMKLAELCGLVLSAQTRFATAVSEIARCAIAHGENSALTLNINTLPGNKKDIVAIIYDTIDLMQCNPDAFAYAGKLSRDITMGFRDGVYQVTLSLRIPFSGVISQNRIGTFIDYFKREAPLSPYDEIRRKNIQLIELAEKLSDSDSSYRQLTDALPLLVFSVSRTGAITFANKSVKERLPARISEFSITTFGLIFHPEDVEPINRGWEMVRKKEMAYTVQVRLKTDNSYRWYLLSVVPKKEEMAEGVQDWIVTMVDIHAQKLVEETLKDNKELREAQEKLKVSNEELSRKNKELEQFAYIASHDLQEPLRKIRNFISLAERRIDEEEKEKLYFNKISSSAERMSRLITDVLNYSKIGQDTAVFESVDLNDVMQDVVSDFEFQVQEKGAAITVGVLPVLSGIPIQLNQLFYNLVGNALKFTERSPVIAITHELTVTPNGKFHKIIIADNGIGIEDQHLSKIFTIFRRLHNQSEYEGTGIGLSLCKKIVENHEGSIRISSTPGSGSTVEVYLPE